VPNGRAGRSGNDWCGGLLACVDGVRVLGQVEAWDGDCLIPLGQPQVRLVLAVLLLEPNRFVSIDRLIRVVWGDEPPASARSGLHNRIAALRVILSGDVQLRTRSSGYVLELDPLRVDAHVFAAAVRRGGDGEDARARAARLAGALGLWRGSLLADVIDVVEESVRTSATNLARRALDLAEKGGYASHAQQAADILARLPVMSDPLPTNIEAA
jgi:DNA-binding SARP family transcriptional activator